MTEELKYNFEEFACFLLIHGSYADLEFTDGEKAMIKNRFGDENFEKVHKDYLALGDYQVLQTIMDYKGIHYPTPARKNELLNLISKVFIADGTYSSLEKNLFHFLEKLL